MGVSLRTYMLPRATALLATFSLIATTGASVAQDNFDYARDGLRLFIQGCVNFSSSPKERPYWLRDKAHLHPIRDDGHAILWAFTTSPNHFAMLNADDGRCVVLILNSELGNLSGELEHALNGRGRIVTPIARASGEGSTVDHYRVVEVHASFEVTLSTFSKSDDAPADLRAILSLAPNMK